MEKEVYNKIKKIIFPVLIIFLIIIICVLIYFLFFHTKACSSKECFFTAIEKCKRATFIKEDPNAAWFYNVIKSDGDFCKIKVRLLSLKDGDIEIEGLQSLEMNCYLTNYEIDFPEKDLSKCSGKLKEEIQEIMIQRMHNYMLQNMGIVKDDFIL